jgi:hypothetical protein
VNWILYLLCGAAAVAISVNAGAANDDDGFVWIDANTRIKVVKPVSTAAGASKAPQEPKKEEKKPEKLDK